MLNQLPQHWRMRWQRLDLDKIFFTESEPKEPTSNNEFVNIGIRSNTPVDVRELSTKRENKINSWNAKKRGGVL